MFNKLREQTSQFLITAIISLVIIGFMFTGYQSFQATPDTVAEVAGEKITYSEYRSALDRQIQYFSTQFGGKPLTNQQIEQFQLKQRTIDGLVSQKLIKVLAEELKTPVSKKQIVKTIKDIPAFKNGDQFDVNRYKQLLAANRLTPPDFEESVSSGLISDSVRSILTSTSISKDLVDQVLKVKKNSKELDIVKINKNALKRKIVVSNKEIQNWLNEEANLKKVMEKFNQDKSFKYDKKEQLKARHILLTTTKDNDEAMLKKINEIKKSATTKNFAQLANKHTMDPSNQGKKGGSLNWFSRGRMVPEFENAAFNLKPGQISEPVKTSYGYHLIYVEDKKAAKLAKLDDHKNDIAKEFIQDLSDDKVEQLLESTKKDVMSLLDKNDSKKISALTKKNNAVRYSPAQRLNLYEKNSQLSSLTTTEIRDLFNSNPGSVKSFSTAIQETLVLVKGLKNDEKASFETVQSELENSFLRQNTEVVLEKLREIYPPKVMTNRM